MSDILNFLVNNAFREAEANGAFENLPGAGKPISGLQQPQNAVVDRMLKEAKAKPAVVLFQEKIQASQKRLRTLTEPDQRKAEMKVLADLQTRLEIEKEAWARFG